MKTTIILLILSFIIVLFGFFAQVFSLQDSEYVWITKEQVKNLLWNLQESLEGKGHVQCMAAEHRSNVFCLDTDHALKFYKDSLISYKSIIFC